MSTSINYTTHRALAISILGKRAIIFSILVVTSLSLYSQSLHQSLRKGDHFFDLDNYKAAEKEYRVAADLAYGNPKALYNLGNALYQQGNWEDAAERFSQSEKGSVSTLDRANALHNLGNALLKQRKFKEAVASYENALRLRPGDIDSKTNLQMAKKKLKEEQQNQQQNQDKNQQNKDQPKDGKQDQNQPQQPQNQQDKQQKQPQSPPQQNQSGQAQQPDQQQEQAQPGKMKKEEAQRMLETAVGPEDQRNARKYRSAKQQNKPKGSKKDW